MVACHLCGLNCTQIALVSIVSVAIPLFLAVADTEYVASAPVCSLALTLVPLLHEARFGNHRFFLFDSDL